MIKLFVRILDELFGKKIVRVIHEKRNRTLIKFNSKFIYLFVEKYLIFNKNKSKTVHLRKCEKEYSERFLRGFMLGLALTDGYLKETFVFNTTSEKLAKNY